MVTTTTKTRTHSKTSLSRRSKPAERKAVKKAPSRKPTTSKKRTAVSSKAQGARVSAPKAKPASRTPKPAKKPVVKKPLQKKAPVKKPVIKKPPLKKPVVRKPVSKKTLIKKTPVAKPKASKALKAAVISKKPVPAPKPRKEERKVPAKVLEPKRKPEASVPAPAPAPPRASAEHAGSTSTPSVRLKTKMLSREFLLELGNAIRAAIAPMTHEARGREVVGSATSGDATFEIDRVAEKALLTFLKNARAPIAYYSEDSGYTTFTNTQPQNLLIVDPIDGTRAAKSGFEACVISIASTRVIERPCMADVDNACVMEIVGDRVFYAERGKGARITQGEHVRRPKLSKNSNLEMMAWTMTVPGRPADLIFPTAAKLIDLSSLKGGFFACNSTSFSLTRLLTSQLDACLDYANRFYRDILNLVKDHFINAGRGTVVGLAPYDLAASLLVAQEAGCVVTDAYGKKLDDVLLLDTTAENHRSIIAAANPELHEKLLRYVDTRVQQLEALLRRRAERAAALAAAQAQAQG